MVIKELIEKIKSMRTPLVNDDDIPDDVTRDKYLRSLRRQRRVQMEELEKERLKKQIAEFNKKRNQKYVWGIKEKIEKRKRKVLDDGYRLLNKTKNKQCLFNRYKL